MGIGSWRQRAIAAVMLTALVPSWGCAYRYTFRTGLPEGERRVSTTMHQSFFGWSSDNVFDLEDACPEGTAEFGSRITFLNWLPAFFTLGLYTPRTAYAVCASGASR